MCTILFRTEHGNGRSKCREFCSVRNTEMVSRNVANFVPYGTRKWSIGMSRILFRTEHGNGQSECRESCSVRNMEMVGRNVANLVPYGTWKWSVGMSRILFRTEHGNGRSECREFCSVRNMEMVGRNGREFCSASPGDNIAGFSPRLSTSNSQLPTLNSQLSTPSYPATFKNGITRFWISSRG
jgi:hypothetical protein